MKKGKKDKSKFFKNDFEIKKWCRVEIEERRVRR